jgi:hypothetical protein
MCPAVGSVFDAIGTGASSLSNQRWPCFEAIEPNRLLAVTDHALLRHQHQRVADPRTDTYRAVPMLAERLQILVPFFQGLNSILAQRF